MRENGVLGMGFRTGSLGVLGGICCVYAWFDEL